MFDIGWSEFLLIAVVALIVIGPKELPGTLRTVGQWVSKVRRMAGEFQHQFQEAIREAELADLKKEVDEMASKAASYTNFDPIADVRRELESTHRDLESTQRQIETAVINPVDAVLPPAELSGPELPAPVPAVDEAAAPSEHPVLAPPAESVAMDAGPPHEPILEPVKSDAGGKPA